MEKIGRFEIVGKLGRGAFGMVYKGRDPIINRLAAIKVMSEATVGDPELVQRFKREAEAAGGLNHRNIVTIYDLGEHGGLPYIAMEFLEGEDLEKMLKTRQDVAVDKKVDMMIQVAEGLHYAHTKNIVHRDIKPANIRLLDDGTIKIMDFGIAKMASSDMTRTGQFMGTVNYMSPEQIKAKKIDGRSDLFAVGIMFYELISLRRPFPGDSITAVIYKIVNENPPPLKELHGTAFEWLEGAVFKCLEKDVEKRWPDCQAFADALRAQTRVQVQVAPSAIDQTLLLARQKATEGDLDGAMSALDSILDHDPDNESVIVTRRSIQARRVVKESESLMSSGRLEQARDRILAGQKEFGEIAELKQALTSIDEEIRAAKAEGLFDSASTKLEERRYEEAIELLKSALVVDPYNDQAKAALRRAEEGKRDADVEELLGDAQGNLDSKDLVRARECVQKALEIDPQSRRARALLQSVDRELKQTTSRTAVNEALFAAKAALAKQQFDEAQKSAEKALELDPLNDEARQTRDKIMQAKLEAERRKEVQECLSTGQALLRKKNFSAAAKKFERAQQLDSQSQDAKLGILAAQRKRTTLAASEQRVPMVPIIAVVVVLAGIAGWFLTRPTEVAKTIALGDAAGDPGRKFTFYAQAIEKDGKAVEKEQARERIAGLAPDFEKAGDFMKVKEILDLQSKWSGGMDTALKGRYLKLAESLQASGVSEGKPAAVRGSFETYTSTFVGGYDKSRDYETMGAVDKLGNKTLGSARKNEIEPSRRLDLYGVAQEVLSYVDSKDPSFGAFIPASEARAERVQLGEQVKGVENFQAEASVAVNKAQDLERKGDLAGAVGSYKAVQKLVAQNRALAGLVDLDKYQQLSEKGVETLNQRMEAESANATAAVLLSRADAFLTAGDLTSARRQFLDVLKTDPNNAVASGKIAEIANSLERVKTLKEEATAALGDGRLDEARTKVKAAVALYAADTELDDLQSQIDSRAKTAEEGVRVAAIMTEADALLSADKLNEADAKYREIISSTQDKSLRQKATDAINRIGLKKLEAQITPRVAEAQELESKGDLTGALAKWNEIKRLNQAYPGLNEKLTGLSRQINKTRIDALEKDLNTAYQSMEKDPRSYQRVSQELLGLDPANAVVARLEAEIKKKAEQAAASQQQLEEGRKAGAKLTQAVESANAALSRNDPDGALRAIQGLDVAQGSVAQVIEAARQQRQKRDDGTAALATARTAVDGGKKDGAVAQANRAKQLWSPLAGDADAIIAAAGKLGAGAAVAAPGGSSGGGADLNALIASGAWGRAAPAAAQTLAKGGTVPPQVAGRVFFNASYAAACSNPCNIDDAKKWAGEAAKFEDTGAKVTNSRWAKTLDGFAKCDMQLKALCTKVNVK